MAKKNEDEKPRAVVQRYSKRLQVLKKAQEYSNADNIAEAVKYYNEYLDSLAKYHGTKEEKLRPTIFDQKNDLAEMLLISQVYWDLSKAFDRSPKLIGECERCLRQFVSFTAGFKYQYLNSEMIRKYLKRGIAYNPKLFEKAYKDIKVQSKKCYIATMCYGENHPTTNYFRTFKLKIMKYAIGNLFVEYYYRLSPKVVNFCESRPLVGMLLTHFIMKPTLNFFSIILKIFKI